MRSIRGKAFWKSRVPVALPRQLAVCFFLAHLLLVCVAPAPAQIQGATSQQTRAYRKAARKAQKDMQKYTKQQQKAMKKSAKAQRKAIKRAQQQRGWTGGR